MRVVPPTSKMTDVVFTTMTARDAQRFEEIAGDFGYRVCDRGGGPGTHVFFTRLENLPDAMIFALLQEPWMRGCVLWMWDEMEDTPEVHAFATQSLTLTR